MAFGLDDAIAAGLKIIDKFVPDPAEKIKAEADLRKDLMAWDQQQNTVNAVEAANPNIFVSGWRPAVGWTCEAAFAYNFVIQPILQFFLLIFGIQVQSPNLDIAPLMTILVGMLGMAGLRSYDKKNGTAT